MIQFGNDKIKDIYVGSDKIKEVYYGSEKVWGGIESIQGGYWVHKDTSVKTYFDLDDPSITDGVMNTPPWKDNCSEVNIPEGVTILGNGCFMECTSLTSITLPESLTSLGASCFEYCSSLTSITLPESLTSLEYGCFASCESLTSITLPAGVTSLADDCFTWCLSLTSINIPESVTSLGSGCFNWCTSLTLATVLPATPPSIGEEVFGFTHTSFNIKVRSPYVNAYKTATNWNQYTFIISAI